MTIKDVGADVSITIEKQIGQVLNRLSSISQLDVRRCVDKMRKGDPVDSFDAAFLVNSLVGILQFCFVNDYDQGKVFAKEFSEWFQMEHRNRYTGQVKPLIDATAPMIERMNAAIALYKDN